MTFFRLNNHPVRSVLLILCIGLGLFSYSLSGVAGFFSFGLPNKVQLDTQYLASLNGHSTLNLNGVNHSQTQQIIVLRLDDSNQPNYANRVNLERTVQPGPFSISLSLSGLHTSNHRPFNLDKATQVMAFQAEGDSVTFSDMTINPGLRFSDSTWALDFGTEQSSVLPGMQLITARSKYLSGPIISVFSGKRSQAYDSLTSDGLKNIKEMHFPVDNGRWFVTMWLKEPGEWELLPHPLNRKIVANGKRVFEERLTPNQWIKKYYLALQNQEVQPTDTPWQALVEKQQQKIQFAVDVSEQEITFDFEGEQPSGSFVSGLVIEKSSEYREAKKVEEYRAKWWNQTWQIQPFEDQPDSKQLNDLPNISELFGMRGSYLNWWVDIPADFAEQGFKYEIIAKGKESNHFASSTQVYYGQWKLERPNLSSTSLVFADNHLVVPLKQTIPASAFSKRRLLIRLSIPSNLQWHPPIYKLKIKTDNHEDHYFDLKIKLQDVPTQPPNIPIGVYLENPVHFSWFHSEKVQIKPSYNCDVQLLKDYGFSSLSLPFSTPHNDFYINEFLLELEAYQQAGFSQMPMAYAAFKRLEKRLGLQKAVIQVEKITQLIERMGLPKVIWSIADEPSNAGENQDIKKTIRYFRNFAPKALIAGHLNNPADMKIAGLFDVVLINGGFGLSAQNLASLRNKGLKVWFYNLGINRAFTGFYLWKNKVDGYLQWHARMPTANPYDPTDGREGDAQLLLPEERACAEQPRVHRGLITLSEGIKDFQLLQKLDEVAKVSEPAFQLQQRLQKRVPKEYENIKLIPDAQYDVWRQEIIQIIS